MLMLLEEETQFMSNNPPQTQTCGSCLHGGGGWEHSLEVRQLYTEQLCDFGKFLNEPTSSPAKWASYPMRWVIVKEPQCLRGPQCKSRLCFSNEKIKTILFGVHLICNIYMVEINIIITHICDVKYEHVNMFSRAHLCFPLRCFKKSIYDDGTGSFIFTQLRIFRPIGVFFSLQ